MLAHQLSIVKHKCPCYNCFILVLDKIYFMKKIIIFIGPPGSGKGTQAKKIAAKYNYGHISTGDLLRNLAADPDGNVEEKQALEDMKQGKLVADWLVYLLAFREIEKYLRNDQGVVLDGAIRNVEQAEKYQEFFKERDLENEVITLEVSLSDNESFNRLARRRVCESCGELIPWLDSTKDLVACPKCDGKLVVRKDDDEEIIKERIDKQGNKALQPIIDYYSNLRILQKIDGGGVIEEVEDLINKALKK